MPNTSAASHHSPDLGPLYQQRWARIAVGAVLTATSVVTVGLGCSGTSVRLVMITGAVCAVFAVAIIRLLPKPRFARGQTLSLWLPIVGVGLTAPLTMHALVSLLISTRSDEFATWCLISCMLTAHVHLVFIGTAMHSTLKRFRGQPTTTTTQIWQRTTLSALVPISGVLMILMWVNGDFDAELGIIAVLITVVTTGIVALLGPIFMWPLMSIMHRAADDERDATPTVR
jgi:hypothetical protein